MSDLFARFEQFNEFLLVTGAAIGIVTGAWARAWNKQRYIGRHREGHVDDIDLELFFVQRPDDWKETIHMWTNIGHMGIVLEDPHQAILLRNSTLTIDFQEMT